MILEAKLNGSEHTADIVVDPFVVLCTISQDWRVSIGVKHNSPIMGGYWMRDEGDPFSEKWERIRLATRDEIVLFESLKAVTELTATFYP